jgi:hypothetical protein
MFWKKIFKKSTLFTVLMIISTVGLSFTAAYYSVYGLSSLFAGSKLEVIIMASALEFTKVIIASYLHNHWNRIGIFLKTYMTIGLVILMIITSAGIYGFLTSAYQMTAFQMEVFDNQIELLEKKRDRFEAESERYIEEQSNLSVSIVELSKGLSNNVIQYKDRDSGEIITTTSSSTRKVLNAQLESFTDKYNVVSQKLDALNDSITTYELKVIEVKASSNVSAELGPLLYLKDLTGRPMDEIVNWFTLLIVLVFDPLAIAMVIALNKHIQFAGQPNIETKSSTPSPKQPSPNSMIKRKRKD